MKVKQFFGNIISIGYMKIHLWLLVGLVISIVLMSCDGSQILPTELTRNDVVKLMTGTYQGTITTGSTGRIAGSNDANIEVTAVNDSTVMIVCTSDIFTDSVKVNVYPNGTYVQMCFTATDFEAYYGYPMAANNYCNNGNWNNSNSMSGNMGNQGSWNNDGGMSVWTNHMTNVHQPGDEHYGQFNMANDSLNYTFQSIAATDTTLYVCMMQKTNR